MEKIRGGSEAIRIEPLALRGGESRPEAAVARALAAREIMGKPEAARARPLAAREEMDRSEAAVARLLAARKSMDIPKAIKAGPLVVRGSASEAGILNAEDREKQLEIMRCATTYFLNGAPAPIEALQATIAEAVEAASVIYGVAEAIEWADGFEFPQDVLDSDLRCFRAAGLNFKTMVERRLSTLKGKRLNPARISKLDSSNPEIRLLLDLADGMRVPRPDGFVPNGKSELSPLRPSYLRVAGAVNKMIADVVANKLGFLLPKALAIQTIPNLHLCTAHWTPKKGKKSGRPIGDLTFVDGIPLNCDETTAASEAYYGTIVHPTIDVIIKMILRFWMDCSVQKTRAQWNRLRLWKMDIRGAYTLLSFRPEDVGLFGMEITGDLIYLQICGIFGWSSTPAAFQVVTRALKWEFKLCLKSYTEMYVDDIIGICFVEDVAADVERVTQICNDLLGPNAIALDKTEEGTRLEIIGYVVDLESMRVSIARKNFLSAIHGFLSVDLYGSTKLKTMQKLASWGSRYGRICRLMRPFCGALNRATMGRRDRYATFTLDEETRCAIRCWRAMLFLVSYDEAQFTRSLDSFNDRPTKYIIEFDASLTGAGVIIYKRVNAMEVCLAATAMDLRRLGFGNDSSFQNTAEYVGAIVGILGLLRLGISNEDIELRGDSISALTWAKTERPRGKVVTNAAMVFTILCVAHGIEAKEATHISGEANYRCDKLSRIAESGLEVADVLSSIGLEGVRDLMLESDGNARDIIQLCRPDRCFTSEGDFIMFWREVTDRVGASPVTNPASHLFPPSFD